MTAANERDGAKSPLLEVRALACRFGAVQAVRDATFSVMEGTITGLIGPNGAGKSTVVDLIAGRTRPQRGSVRFAGSELTGQPTQVIARQGMIRTFQQANVFSRLTVLENLLVGARPWAGEGVGMALGPRSRWAAEERALQQRAWEILDRFDLRRLANEYAGALSGGQKRLVELMRALMADPKMLLLDEPMAGVNPSLANSVADRLEELHASGMTMLMIEHDLQFVERLCDPVVVMARGAVLAEGSMAQLQENTEVVDAYLGA
jgi:ABC-type branched-subunit amino acid transport system ATPase component